MTFVATLRIYGIDSRNFINTSMISPCEQFENEKSCLQPGGRSRGKPDVFVDLFHDVIDVSEDAMRQSDPSRWVDVVAVSVHTV